MKFEDALKSMREGAYIARESNKENDLYSTIYFLKEKWTNVFWTIHRETQKHKKTWVYDYSYYIDCSDILADDWEIVNESIIENIIEDFKLNEFR